MKKYIAFIAIALVAIVTASCNKDNFNYPPGTVGISKITYFPVITVKGALYYPIAKGTAYTDPGVTATGGGASIPVVTTGTVNVNTPGVYTLTYTATNSDGFPATASRTVIVYSTDATATNNDFSGNYARTTNGSIAAWTKIAPGVYTIFNPGGAPGTNLTVVAINPTGYTISIPSQIAGGAPTSSASETATPGVPVTTLSKYSMEIVNPGYGTSIRTFIKQ